MPVRGFCVTNTTHSPHCTATYLCQSLAAKKDSSSMSSEEEEHKLDGETSRVTEESSSEDFNKSRKVGIETTLSLSSPKEISAQSPTVESDEMKRASAKKLIERYFYQLSDGCGNPKCGNKNCASSGSVETMSPNQAAARAIQLYTQEAPLCEMHPSKVARTQLAEGQSPTSAEASSRLEDEASSRNSQKASASGVYHSPATTSSHSKSYYSSPVIATSPTKPISDEQSYIDEERLNQLLDECQSAENYSPLIRNLGKYFSSRESMARSFQKLRSAHIDAILEKAPKDLMNLKKEDFRTLEGDMDKDEDSCVDNTADVQLPHDTTVDLVSLRRAMQKLYTTHAAAFEPINIAFHSLAIGLTVDLRLLTQKEQIEEIITVFVIIFEIVVIGASEFLEFSLPAICNAASFLPVWAQARLSSIWGRHCTASIRNLLQTLQQLISLQVIAGTNHQNSYVQDNETVVWATKVMKIIYYANLIAGDMESAKLREDDETDALDTTMSTIPEEESFYGYNSKFAKPSTPDDALSTELLVNVLDCRKPFLSFEEFYNEPLSDAIKMDNDYLNYKNRRVESKKFSFMLYSFILTPATKILALYYDNRIRMYSERRLSIYHTQAGQPPNPYLKLRVRRDQIIEDALVELEVIALENPKDLKKQLVVEFIGEQGIDEGGVSKEFFQLIVEKIFNPDYGMFVYQEDTKTVWFNSTSFENEAQFTLIGIVLGLAIYNNIILPVNFPMVVYRKLMGIKGSFADLADWNPQLHQSLSSMLDYQEADMEDVFMQTFKISYADVFGSAMTHELKPNGDNVPVNQDNKQEFVDLYTDYLLNSSVEKQFRAFRRGFQMVTDESPLHLLFRPEEVELLVCGSKKFDFNELEKSTEYEGGFTEKSSTIVDFWEIVHALPMESKKKLLEFTTGSDRVPVGGLSQLKLVIARNGPDSDRLPTSHTCFNVLLLPEYTNKAKLEDRLLKAINYSKGFGML